MELQRAGYYPGRRVDDDVVPVQKSWDNVATASCYGVLSRDFRHGVNDIRRNSRDETLDYKS